MIGEIKNIIGKKMYGFIRSEGIEYFFHKDDYSGDFRELEQDMQGTRVLVEFDIAKSDRGPRAANVRRLVEPRTAKGSLD